MRVPRIPLRGSVADGAVRPAPQAGYLRDSRSAVLNTRPAPLRSSRDEIRVAWTRAAGLALDLIQNSGQLRGAADQVVADTVGEELVLNPQPDLSGLGYSPEETADFVRLIKKRWKHWSWNARECDLRGKFTLPQLIDVALRWDMAFGEATGVMSYLPPEARPLGMRTGTKLCLKTPTALVQDTSEWERLFQGVIHDEVGRPVAYRFEELNRGFRSKKDYPAFDRDGRQLVIHVFDPMDAGDVRGISRMAAAFRQHIQREILVDTTIQTAILQTVLAVTLSSKSPSKDAFEAIQALEGEGGSGLGDAFQDYFLATLDRAANGKISIGSEPQISHLAPDEELGFKAAGVPGPQFLPVNAALSREMARAIGITYGGLTMDHTNATYSSVRMENSSIWPVVLRRRSRTAAPIKQVAYEHWLDEEIGAERILFKGGYEVFAANREKICWALWQGPAKPTADDGKSAKASTEKLLNGTSTLAIECAELGNDPDEVFEQRAREHKRYVSAGLPSPFVPRNSAPDKGEDKEEPAKSREAA